MSVPASSLPGPWRTLRVAAPLPLRVGVSIVALLCACGAALAAVLVTDPGLATLITVPVTAVAVASLWAAWVPRLILVRMDGDAGLMPGAAGAVRRALSAAVLGTVLLPAALLVLAGTDLALALPAMVAAAAAAMLLSLLPAWTWLAASFLPLASMLVYVVAVRLPPGLLPAWEHGLLFQPRQLAVLALLLLALAAGRWRQLVRRGVPAATPLWRQPSVLAHRHGAWGGNRSTVHAAQLPEWFWPSGQTGDAGPGKPVRAIRVLLGTPFAPLTRRQWLLQWGVAVLAIVVVALYLVPEAVAVNSGADLSGFLKGFLEGGLAGGVVGGAGVMVGMFGGRLARLVRRQSGELSELALLPGLGSAPVARRHLLRAVFGAPARGLAAGTVLLLALVVGAGMGPAGVAGTLLACAAVGLLTVQCCLRPLAGLPLLRWWGYLQVGVAVLLAGVTLTWAVNGWPAPPAATAVIAALWAAVLLAAGLQVVQAWRRIIARPHPFVQE